MNRIKIQHLLLVLVCGSIGFSALVNAAAVSQVATDSGTYQGHASEYTEGVTVFHGLAYAAPPVRDLRWKPPAPAIPFAGVRQADRIGPACWQARNPNTSMYARGDLRRSEDCLYLNIFTGAADTGDALPVMIWFHGGGNTAGHGGPLIFDGSNLAARDAVIVTANYRLGPFGFLAHPALTRESENNSSGMYGILDQIEVLQWVQNNIAGFGGDPNRVTIFGQSAGGTDVCLIMSSPLAEGLVHGVIGQSPGCITMNDTLTEDGHRSGENFVRSLGITGSGDLALEQMRDISPQQIVSTMSTAGSGGGPVIDGWVVPGQPYDMIKAGRQNRIPIMVGGLADEYFGLQHLSPQISEAELDQYLARVFGDKAAAVKTAYADAIARSPLDAQKEISGDNGFILAARLWGGLVQGRGDDAYVYYFSRKPPVFRLYTPEQPDLNEDGGQRSFGAYHSGELAYVFDNLDLVGIGWDADDHALSETMADYWVNFARTGNPNGPGLPEWPIYDAASDVVQLLDAEVRAGVHPKKEALDRMERLYLEKR
ncbi:MAG: carboxylesterase family protein [Proteobacteria bacterium]|nr:carboxylesterase family protein [Pseudomonadota bacterium]